MQHEQQAGNIMGKGATTVMNILALGHVATSITVLPSGHFTQMSSLIKSQRQLYFSLIIAAMLTYQQCSM